MTYAALGEILLHLNDFTINDAHSEGIYRLRLTCYYEKPVQQREEGGNLADTLVMKV